VSSDTVIMCRYSDTVSAACYPHINLCIPAVTVWSTVESYLNTADMSVLRQLTMNDEVTRQLWRLDSGSCSRRVLLTDSVHKSNELSKWTCWQRTFFQSAS